MPDLSAQAQTALTTIVSRLKAGLGDAPAPVRDEVLNFAATIETQMQTDLDEAADACLDKLPVLGPMADAIVRDVVDTTLGEGLADLKAALKAAVGHDA